MTAASSGPSGDPERPGLAAILDAWQATLDGTEPVINRFALGTDLGGPLDAVAAYPTEAGWLALSLGLTDLDDKRSAHPGISGFGFEFTIRLPRPQPTTIPPAWVPRLLAALGAQMRAGADFGPGDWVLTPQPLGGEPTNAPLTCLAIDYDPQLRSIATPNGTADFLTIVGLTAAEGAAADQAGTAQPILDALRAADPALTTDPSRPSVR